MLIMDDGPWRASVYGEILLWTPESAWFEFCSVSFMFMQARLLKLNLAFQLTYHLLESYLGIEAVSAILTSPRHVKLRF